MKKSQFLNNMIKPLFYTVFLMLLGISTSWACTTPPPPPPQAWVINHGIDPDTKMRHVWVGIEVDSLFEITSPTMCTCGIGIPSAFASSVKIKGVKLAVTDMLTKEMDVVEEFGFSEDASIAEFAQDNAVREGQEWVGFSGMVNPFDKPILGPNEKLKLWFEVSVAPNVPFQGIYSFSMGGAPGSDHPPEQLTTQVSEPESLSLAVLGAGALLLLRSRRKQPFNISK